MNILFLDYDGVVNTPFLIYKNDEYRVRYNFPEDGCVNDRVAVDLVSKFCVENNFSIVVSSTWRFESNYKECLINAGLHKDVKIIGKTPTGLKLKSRGDEISAWLGENPGVENYVIIDDDSDMGIHADRLIRTRHDVGFKINDFYSLESMVQKMKR